MAAAADLAIQKAIFDHYEATPPIVLGNAVKIYDEVPQSAYDGNANTAPFPFVTIDAVDSGNWDDKTAFGSDTRFQLSVWSRYQGKKELAEISDHIQNTFQGVVLTVSGVKFVEMYHTNSNQTRDPDGRTYHQILTFRILTHE